MFHQSLVKEKPIQRPIESVSFVGGKKVHCYNFMHPIPELRDEVKAGDVSQEDWPEYVGIKLIQAIPAISDDGVHGYRVRYPDGYLSWCPAEAFQKAYFPIDYLTDPETGEKTSIISEDTVADFVKETRAYFLDEDMTVVGAKTIAGHAFYDMSSLSEASDEIMNIAGECSDDCEVEAHDYGRRALVGTWFCRNQIMEHLEFILQWAKNGLSR